MRVWIRLIFVRSPRYPAVCIVASLERRQANVVQKPDRYPI